MEQIVLTGPEGKLVCRFALTDARQGAESLAGVPSYTLEAGGRTVVARSPLYFELADGSFTDGFRVTYVKNASADETWETAFGEDRLVRNRYNEAAIGLESGDGLEMELVFRVFDCGLGFRYVFKRNGACKAIEILRELTHFNFDADYECFAGYTAQCLFEKTAISRLRACIDRPAVVELGDKGPYAAIGEAALFDYARMRLAYGGNNALVSALSGKPLYFFKEEAALKEADENKLIKVKAALPLATPWRVIAYGEDAAALYRGRYIFQNLNPPCALADTGFIKPGKVIREATLTTAGAKACVDFCVRRHMQYIELDTGWYGPESDFASDATFVSIAPERYRGPLDMAEVVAYARARGIGVILYINQRAMMNQLDELLPLYKSWGVSGLKYGFVEVGSQRWTAWLHDCVRKAAEHGLVLSVHDEYRPTGNQRTYPNLLTCEGIYGDEEKQPASNTLVHIFSRLLCGPADNTVCYFNERVDEYWSHAYQLAKAVCIFSPLQFLYWYDRPAQEGEPAEAAGGARNIISDEPELAFYDSIPTVWDETVVLDGEIGARVAMARRSGDTWFVGIMNGGDAWDCDISLGFLDGGEAYEAVLYSDDASLGTRTNVRATTLSLSSVDGIRRGVPPSNGVAIRITKKGA